jgi:hypothetical protein
MAPSSSRPPGGGGGIYRTQGPINPTAYQTVIPLIVAERCRNAGRYEDGTRAEPPALLATWYALRWLMAAFPDRRGFGQRAIARIAGYDQKSVHRRLRKLLELGLVIEVGRLTYTRLTGKDDKPKEQPLYSIPEPRLNTQSSEDAPNVIDYWERELFGPKSPEPQPPPEAQLALDLSDPLEDQGLDPVEDQALDPLKDQGNPPDPLADQGLDPLKDQTDPVEDQGLDPLADQGLDPLADHMEGRKEGRKEGLDALTREGPDSRAVAGPPGEEPLQLPPFELWSMFATAVNPVADRILLGRLAAAHDATTDGHGTYWLGRAILEVKLGGGADDWMAAVRATLRRWKDSASYGSDAPRSGRAARVPMVGQARAVGAASATGPKVSDLEILTHPSLENYERQRWLTRFRNAPPEDKPAVLERFRTEHPRNDHPPAAEQAAAD